MSFLVLVEIIKMIVHVGNHVDFEKSAKFQNFENLSVCGRKF